MYKKLCKTDQQRYYNNFANPDRTETQAGLTARLIFYTHQVEKGLSHQKIRPGFGKNAFENLAKIMPKIRNHEDPAYQSTLAAIRSYFDHHNKYDFDISDKEAILGKKIVQEVTGSKSKTGGRYQFSASDKLNNSQKTFVQLFENRASVREYSDAKVSRAKLHNAVKIASKTPSVCNRQSYRVTYIYDPKIIEKTLAVQGGFGGYELPPVLALITADIEWFINENERNQAYIDGGLFLMAFLLGLENESLAACTLNAMFWPKQDEKIREILNISPSQVMIAFVAIGNFRDINYAAKSFRYPKEHIIREIGK